VAAEIGNPIGEGNLQRRRHYAWNRRGYDYRTDRVTDFARQYAASIDREHSPRAFLSKCVGGSFLPTHEKRLSQTSRLITPPIRIKFSRILSLSTAREGLTPSRCLFRPHSRPRFTFTDGTPRHRGLQRRRLAFARIDTRYPSDYIRVMETVSDLDFVTGG
jgi:hypothetical protein